MISIVIDNFKHALVITIFVFVMMLLVDYLNVATNGKMRTIVRGNRLRQYSIASLLGATPGCLGSFLNVSFYIHGVLSFGAMAGAMVATSGDEAFVMLSMFPGKALLLFAVLFVLGILLARVTDFIADRLGIKACQECDLQKVHSHDKVASAAQHHEDVVQNVSWKRAVVLSGIIAIFAALLLGLVGPGAWNWKRITMLVLVAASAVIVGSVRDHYLEEHIWKHLIVKHLWRVFLWAFGALLIVHIGLDYFNLNHFIESHLVYVLLLSVFVGIVPESGPHMVFVMLFAQGSIPFSVLLASSIVQDGHGMLPLLSYTLRDSIYIKIFNMVYGLIIGLLLMAVGI